MSNLSREESLEIFARVFGGLAGCSLVALAVVDESSNFPPSSLDSLHDFLDNCYMILFGILMVFSEFRLRFLLRWFSFLLSFKGLGFWYFFIGLYAFDTNWEHFIVSAACWAVGGIYFSFACCCVEFDEKSSARARAAVTNAEDEQKKALLGEAEESTAYRALKDEKV